MVGLTSRGPRRGTPASPRRAPGGPTSWLGCGGWCSSPAPPSASARAPPPPARSIALPPR
eukprot:646346-Pyramimonas_sp.AAC.2